MHIALWKRKANSLLLKAVPNLEHDRTLDVADAGRRVVNPDSQVKTDRAVPKRRDKTHRLGLFQDALDATRGGQAELDCTWQICLICNSDRNMQSYGSSEM